MQHLIDLTFADYCGRLVLLVFLLLDAGTTIYALHHQPVGGKTMIVEGNPIVAALMRLVGVEGGLLLSKALGIVATYLLTPIWPIFLFAGAAGLRCWRGSCSATSASSCKPARNLHAQTRPLLDQVPRSARNHAIRDRAGGAVHRGSAVWQLAEVTTG